MDKSVKKRSYFWKVVRLLVGAGLIYHADSIWGQIKFERLCKTEAGPKFYNPVAKGAGWYAESQLDANTAYENPFRFGASFVRWTDREGKTTDVYKLESSKPWRSSYEFRPVDEGKPIAYLFRLRRDIPGDDPRFSRVLQQIIDLSTDQVAAEQVYISFDWTDSTRMILHMPTTQSCGRMEPGNNMADVILKQGEGK